MEVKDWAKETSRFPEIQQQISQDCDRLVKAFFPADDEYGQEKFIKLYCDNLRNLENNCLRSHGIHPSQYQDKLHDKAFFAKFPALQEEVRKIMVTESKRAARFAQTSLSSAQARAINEGQAVSQLLNVAREMTMAAKAGGEIRSDLMNRLIQAVDKMDKQNKPN